MVHNVKRSATSVASRQAELNAGKGIHVAHIVIDGAVDAPDTLGKMLGACFSPYRGAQEAEIPNELFVTCEFKGRRKPRCISAYLALTGGGGGNHIAL